MENAAVLAKPIPPKEAGRAVRDAAVHWSDWRAVFGHGGDLRDNPILACRIHFGCFLWEFGVGRNVGFQTTQADDGQPPPVLVERAKRLQQRLRSDNVFLAAITSGDARALAACGHSIATTHSAKGSANGLHSLLSKVAALCNPSAFIASDTFARAGLSWLARGTRTSFDPVQSGERRSERSAERFERYQAKAREIATTAELWPKDVWNEMNSAASDLDAHRIAFRLRVVDHLAMAIGRKQVAKAD